MSSTPPRMAENQGHVQIAPLTEELIPQVARLQQEAFAGYMNARLGLRYQHAFVRWFCKAEDTIALVALNEAGELLGYVVGAPLGYNTHLNRAVFWPAVTSILLRPWLFLDSSFRSKVTGRIRILTGREPQQTASTPDLPTPIYSIVGLGVTTRARGRNIGVQLFAAAEAIAAGRQVRSLRLSVFSHNHNARRVFEKLNWRPVQSNPVPGEIMHYIKILPLKEAQDG